MAHTIGTIGTRTSSTSNPITVSQTINGGATVMVLLLNVKGGTNRAGGAPTWGGFTLTQANSTQKAASSPEASAELWYLVDPPNGTNTLTIPNTGGLTIIYEVVLGKAGAGKTSAIDQTNGANGTSANPAPGSVTTTVNGDIGFAIVATGAQTWAPSAQVGTVITNVDDGATGGGTQYHLQATLGAVNLGWTFGTSDDWGAVVAYFKEVDAPAITVDRWKTSAQVPTIRAKKLATALIPSLFFVPVITAEAGPTPVYVGGQSCEPIKIEHFQYQASAFVPVVQAAAPEVSYAHLQQTQQPTFKPKRLIQYGVNVAIASERIYFDAVTAQIQQPTFLPKRRWSEIVGSPSPVVAQAEQNILTKWSQPAQIPVRLRPRIQDTSGNVHFLGTLKERATPDKWAYISPDPVRLPKRRQGESVSSPAPVVQAEVISLDKWNKEIEQPQFRAKRTITESVRPFIQPSETITFDKWARETERPQFKQRRVITETVKPLVPIVPPETVTTDKWTVAVELPRQRLLRRQDANGDLTFIVVTVPKPLAQTAEPGRQAKRLTLTGVEPPRIEEQIPESWRVETQSPITRAIQRVYESAQPLLRDFAETVSLDRFYLNQNEPRWDVKRWQHLYPTFSVDTRLFETPPLQGAPAPDERSFRVPYEDRFYDVPHEDRFYRVPAEERFVDVE